MTLLATALPSLSPFLALFLSLADAHPGFQARLAAETNVAGGLTAAEAALRADATSGEVEARRAEIDAAVAAVDQTLVGYFPRLSGSARYTRFSAIDAPLLGVVVAAPGAPNGLLPTGTPLVNVPVSLPTPVNQTSFQASLAVPLSDYLLRVGPTHAAAARAEDASRANLDATARKVRADVRALYYAWARTRLSALVADAAAEQAREHLGDATKAAEAGTASRADVLRVEAQLAVAEQASVRAHTLTTALEARLRTVMHVDAGTPLAIGEPLDTDLVLVTPGRDLDRLAEAAARDRPEVRALDAAIASLGKQARAAKGLIAPQLAVIGELTDANPNPRYVPAPERFETTWSVTAQLSWSPNDAVTAAKAGAALTARQAQAAAQRRALLDGVRVEIANALQAVDETASAQQTAARALVSAEESYRVRRALFQNGRATSVELTDAETELTRARLDRVAARIDARVAEVQLRHALGDDGRADR